MSMDESDHHSHSRTSDRKYVIVRPEWRAPPVSDFLHVMDNVGVSHRFQHTNSRKGRATPGNWPRLRISARHRVDQSREPVPGLPKNFYDQRWLAGISEETRRSLEMKPAVDIRHTPQVLECVLFPLSADSINSLLIITSDSPAGSNGSVRGGTSPSHLLAWITRLVNGRRYALQKA